MPKEFWIFFLITLIFMIGLFSFLYKSISPAAFNQIEKVEFEPLENFKIKKEDNFQVITNTNLGFLAKIPSNWKYQLDEVNKEIIFYLKERNINEQNFQNECIIGLKVEYRASEKNFSILKNMIAQLKENPQKQGNIKVIEVAKKDALKERISFQGIGKVIRVSLPFYEKVFVFETMIPFQKEKECQKYFDEFLNSIELKD